MSKNGIIKGTLVLTIAGIFVRILGFYNRIFLTRLIGVEALGIYQLIFPVYLLAFSISCQGLQTALTKQVSHYHALNQRQSAKTVFHLALLISSVLGFLLSITIFFASDYIALHFLKHSGCGVLLRILAPSVFFVSIKGAINGYFLGIKKTGYNAWSLAIEQIVRLLATMLLGSALSAQFRNATLATLALTIGEAVSCLTTVLFYLYSEPAASKTQAAFSRPYPAGTRRKLLSLLLGDSVPLTLNRTALTLLSSIEAVLLPAMLYRYSQDKSSALEIFGCINGVVMPFLLFPSTLTNSLSTILLPEVAYANAKGNKKAMEKAFHGSALFCMVLGIVSGIFFLLFGEALGSRIFQSEMSGVILKQMALLCPLIYTATTLSSILNGIDSVVLNLIYHILSIGIRILFILYAVPVYGTAGYIYGMFVSYLFLTAAIIINIVWFFRHREAQS